MGYLPTIQESLRSRPVSERHPVARPRVNTQIAQGNGPWLELGDLGREVGVCRGKGYTFVAVHCIKDPGLWGWSLGSSQSCHFKMGLCLPARDRRKKIKGLQDRTAKPHTPSPIPGPNPASRNSLSIRGHPQYPHTWTQIPWPTVASPAHQKPLTARAIQQLHDPEAVVQQGFGPHQLQA